MDKDFNDLVNSMEDLEELSFICQLLSFIRKYHRRLSNKSLYSLLAIVLQVLNRDVELVNPKGWLIENFDYFILNLENRYDLQLNQFKYKFMYQDFRLEDVADLLAYVNSNLDGMAGDIDFILRIPEALFKGELQLKNINEYGPSMARWGRLIARLGRELGLEK